MLPLQIEGGCGSEDGGITHTAKGVNHAKTKKSIVFATHWPTVELQQGDPALQAEASSDR